MTLIAKSYTKPSTARSTGSLKNRNAGGKHHALGHSGKTGWHHGNGANAGFSDKLDEVPRFQHLTMTYVQGLRDGQARRDHPEDGHGDLLR